MMTRKYDYYIDYTDQKTDARYEQLLFSALKQTGYSYLDWYWMGEGITKNKMKWYYLPALILLPKKNLGVDFLGHNNKKTINLRKRIYLAKLKGYEILLLRRSDSQQEMYSKIMLECTKFT